MRMSPRLATMIAAAGTTLLLAGCGGSSSAGDAFSAGSTSPAPTEVASSPAAAGAGEEEGGPLVVGSAGFTESALMAEMYAALLDKVGYDASVKTVANRELYEPALESGEISVVPEYAATMAEFLNRKVNGAEAAAVASSDLGKTVAALNKLAEPLGLKALEPAEAVDQNAFVVTKSFAEKNKLKTLSDLGASGISVSLAAPEECATRPFCQPGLEKTYGITISKINPLGVSTVQTKQSVKDGTDQLGVALSTDGTLSSFDLVVLEDDKGLQNADNLIPVVNTKAVGDKAIAVLNSLAPVLTTSDLAELNSKVDAERMKAADVAKEYLTAKGLI